MVNCEIKFDNNSQGIFYSGQVLSGVVIINNDKPRKINGINLKIEGFSKCKWTESEGTGKSRRSVTFSGREDYLSSFSKLVGSYEASKLELSQGLHTFNFSCLLPPQLPTSFESKYGSIRYQIKVEMDRPWKFDIKYSFGFTVIKVLDLNVERPSSRNPLKAEQSKTFYMGFGSKPFFISAEIPMSGFVSGQKVPVSIKVNNESSVDVEETKVSIKKIIQYNSQTPRTKTRERIETAAEVRHIGIASKSKANIEAPIAIPPLAPTNVGYCRVVQVSYEIQVLAKVGGMHRNICIRLPITIGTVPFYGLYYSPVPQVPYNMIPSTSTAPPLTPTIDPGLPGYPTAPSSMHDLPPPSYQEAMHMSTDDVDNEEGSNDEKPFSPMYPVFNIGTANSQQNFNSTQFNEAPPAYGFAAAPQYNEKRPL